MSHIHDAIKARHKEATGSVGVLSAFSCETSTKTTAGNERILRIVVTTDDIDLVGDVVDPKGADTKYITAKGQNKVFADHQYDMEHCVGSLRYLTYWPNPKNPKGLMASIVMRRSRLADEAWTIFKEIGIGASIGFEAHEVTDYKNGDPSGWKSANSIIRKWRLLEISLTCFPCNVSCQSDAMDAPDESKMAMLDGLVTKGSVSRETAQAFGLDLKKFQLPKVRIVSGLS